MKQFSRSTALIGIITLVTMLVVACHAIPFGIPGVWSWVYLPLTAPLRALFPLIGLGVLLVVARVWLPPLLNDAPTRQQEWKALAGLWLATGVMAVSVALMHPAGFLQLATLIINPASNSYYSTALQHPDTFQLLNGYEQKMNGFISHAQTQTAGPVVVCSALHQTLGYVPGIQDIADTLFALTPGINAESIAKLSAQYWQVTLTPKDVAIALFIALTLIGLGSLTVVPIYFLGKWHFKPATGLVAATAFALLPAFHSFTPSVDQIYPCVTALLLCLTWLAVRSPERGWLWLGVAGLLLSGAIFMNLGLLTLIPLCALYWLFGILSDPTRATLAASLKSGAALLLGIIVPLILVWLVFHFNTIAVFHTSDYLRDELYIGKHRPYFVSLLGNLWDFFAFCGVPVTLLFLWSIVQEVRGIRQRGAGCRDLITTAPLVWAFILVVLALDLSGKTRGEVARMWMFLTPCVLIGAAAQLTERAPNRAANWRMQWLPLGMLQFMQIIVFQYFVRVWGY